MVDQDIASAVRSKLLPPPTFELPVEISKTPSEQTTREMVLVPNLLPPIIIRGNSKALDGRHIL